MPPGLPAQLIQLMVAELKLVRANNAVRPQGLALFPIFHLPFTIDLYLPLNGSCQMANDK